MKNFRIINASNIFCLTALILIAYKFISPINNYWDIIGADEISYLKFGKNIFQEVNFGWGFIYNLWYKLLSVIATSTVDLYYLNYKVLIICIPVLLFICLLCYNVNTLIAFCLSFLYLISKLHITTWPFVSDFCCILILIYFIAIKFVKDDGIKILLFTFFCLLLYLTRPEYIIAFIPALAYSFYINRTDKKRWIISLLMIIIVVYIGTRTTKTLGINRALFAYVQHYAKTYQIWHSNTTFDIYDYLNMAPKIFGRSYTLLGSILYNPTEAIRHVLTCIGFYLLTLFKCTEDLLLPNNWFKNIGKIKHLLFIALLIYTYLLYRKNRANINIKQHKIICFSFVVFFIAAAIPNFLIGYTPHYIQLHFILYVLLVCILLFRSISINIKSWMLFVLATIFYFITPEISSYSFQHVDIDERKNLPVQKLANVMNELNDTSKQHCLLAFQTNLHYVIEGNNFSGFDVFSVNKPFLQFITEQKVDCIYVNKQLLNDRKLNKDKQWKIFYDAPEKYNFYKQKIPASNNYLLIRKANYFCEFAKKSPN